MRFPIVRVLHVAASILAIASLGACATRPKRQTAAQQRCMVTNLTPHALDVRAAVGGFSPRSIGELNPGELLTESAPCAARWVLVRGIAIPHQVGSPQYFNVVQDLVYLDQRSVTRLTLHWP